METKTPKQFIEDIYFHNLGAIMEKKSPYISFAIMAIGIEFLGKCLDDNEQDWHAYRPHLPAFHFNKAITDLRSFRHYRPYMNTHKFFDSFRNGFAHTMIPKSPITLVDSQPDAHLKISQYETLILNCESMYDDFKGASNDLFKLIETPGHFKPDSKVFNPVLGIGL